MAFEVTFELEDNIIQFVICNLDGSMWVMVAGCYNLKLKKHREKIGNHWKTTKYLS